MARELNMEPGRPSLPGGLIRGSHSGTGEKVGPLSGREASSQQKFGGWIGTWGLTLRRTSPELGVFMFM